MRRDDIIDFIDFAAILALPVAALIIIAVLDSPPEPPPVVAPEPVPECLYCSILGEHIHEEWAESGEFTTGQYYLGSKEEEQ